MLNLPQQPSAAPQAAPAPQGMPAAAPGAPAAQGMPQEGGEAPYNEQMIEGLEAHMQQQSPEVQNFMKQALIDYPDLPKAFGVLLGREGYDYFTEMQAILQQSNSPQGQAAPAVGPEMANPAEAQGAPDAGTAKATPALFQGV